MISPAEEIGWLTGYLVEQNRLDDLESVTKRLLSRSQSPALMNNVIYLDAITSDGEKISDGVIDLATQIAENNPKFPQLRFTLALLLCLRDRNEEALAAYREEDRSGMGWHSFSPAARATLALVLAKNGSIAPFPNVSMQIDWAAMTTAEQRFFRLQLDSYLNVKEEEREECGVQLKGECLLVHACYLASTTAFQLSGGGRRVKGARPLKPGRTDSSIKNP